MENNNKNSQNNFGNALNSATPNNLRQNAQNSSGQSFSSVNSRTSSNLPNNAKSVNRTPSPNSVNGHFSSNTDSSSSNQNRVGQNNSFSQNSSNQNFGQRINQNIDNQKFNTGASQNFSNQQLNREVNQNSPNQNVRAGVNSQTSGARPLQNQNTMSNNVRPNYNPNQPLNKNLGGTNQNVNSQIRQVQNPTSQNMTRVVNNQNINGNIQNQNLQNRSFAGNQLQGNNAQNANFTSVNLQNSSNLNNQNVNNQGLPLNQQNGGERVPPSNSSGDNKIDNKKPKSRKRKLFGIMVACFLAIVSILGIVFGISKSNATYTVTFVYGPFGSTIEKVYQSGEIVSPEELENRKSDNSDEIIAEFSGWYTDEDFTNKYTPTSINRDMTLYAGYSNTGYLTTSFYIKDLYNDSPNDYIYVADLESKFYTEMIDFKNATTLVKNFSSEIYDGASNVLGYDRNNNSLLGDKGVAIDSYSQFINSYYEIVGFKFTSSLGEQSYTINDSIPTPSGDIAVYVELAPKDVKINFDSNLGMLKDYYESVVGSGEGLSDEVYSMVEEYNSSWNFLNYQEIADKGNLLNPNPDFHTFVGWSFTNPDELEDLSDFKADITESVSKIDRIFLQDKTEITLYAVWEEKVNKLMIVDDVNNIGQSNYIEISVGQSQEVEEWVKKLPTSIEKDGYTLVGFNSSPDLKDENAVSFYEEINGSVNSPYFDPKYGCIVLYAVYKKDVNDFKININDDDLDATNVDKTQLESLLNINLNLIEKYSYDKPITISYDESQNVISISNLIEGASLSLPNFERENYTLNFYNLLGRVIEVSSTYFVSLQDLDTSSNITFNAIWQGVSYNLTINNFLEDTNSGYGEKLESEVLSIEYGTELYLKYNFVDNGSLKNSTTLSFDIYNASNSQMINTRTYTLEKVGFDFIKWIDGGENDFSSSTTSGYVTSKVFSVNKEFNEISAVWDKKEYTLTYKFSGGLYDNDGDGSFTENIYVINNIEYQTNIDILSEDSVYYYAHYLEGWSLTESENPEIVYDYLDASFVLGNDTTLYAVWSEAKIITLYFDALKDDVIEVIASRDGKYTLTGQEFQVIDGLESYLFDSFNEFYDGSGLTYEIGVEYDALTSKELYAMWYMVDFADGDSQGIYGVESGDKPDSFYVARNAVVTLPQNSWTPSIYYIFDGWEYKDVVYDDKFIFDETCGVDASLSVGQTIFFDAHWKMKDVMVELYLGDNTQTDKITGYSVNNEFVVSRANSTYPTKVGYEVDYVYDKDNAYYREKQFLFHNNPPCSALAVILII